MKTLPTKWEAVCKKKGISSKIPFDVSKLSKELQNYLIACYQNPIIIEVLNDGWVPDYNNTSQPKYEIRWIVKANAKRPSGVGLAYYGGCDIRAFGFGCRRSPLLCGL